MKIDKLPDYRDLTDVMPVNAETLRRVLFEWSNKAPSKRFRALHGA
ncbi:hypothetical protein [Vibrio aestuarianus]|nr:hypothetical protein [Vibrio aestuarianus]MDE1327677.1 hypothetical protein [Vibrio aestuarianus]NGZ62164.1 hypothetical protein [Vibrio aestuarianus subsp. cardii]